MPSRTDTRHRICVVRRTHTWSGTARVSRPVGICVSLCLFALVLHAPQAEAQESNVPKLVSQVPQRVLRARTRSQGCLTGTNHHDPCASVRIKGTLFTIAWDTHTKEITYLFTSDHRFITDSELGVGGGCRLVDEGGKAFDLAQYMNWLVTPRWADTAGSLSGDATWYAALRRDTTSSEYGRVVGFVQSRYLKIGP
jgi:hypothetical protein